MSSRFVVLTYHRVTPDPDPLRPGLCHASSFASQLATLSRFFSVLTLGEAVDRMVSGQLPSRCVCITFDDGYRDNCEIALPLLRAAGLPATFFIATGYLGGGTMWNDYVFEAVRHRAEGEWDLDRYGLGTVQIHGNEQRGALARKLIQALKYEPQDRRAELASDLLTDHRFVKKLSDLMMDQHQVRELADSGMEIGAHTVTHPILNEVGDTQVATEMADSRSMLRQLTGQAIDMFAYPNGKPDRDYAARHAEMAEDSGFRAAVATHWGYASPRSQQFQLPRVGLESETGWRFAAKLARVFWQKPQDTAS